jgi:hypothetical protein
MKARGKAQEGFLPCCKSSEQLVGVRETKGKEIDDGGSAPAAVSFGWLG